MRRAGEPVFDAVIDLEGVPGGTGAEGGQEQEQERRWRIAVVTDVRGVVDELLDTGAAPRPEMRMPLAEDEENVGFDDDHDRTDELDEVGGFV